MSKKELIGQKMYQNFMSQFWFIFLGKKLKKACFNLKDKNQVLVGFTLAFLCNRVGSKQIRRILWKNRKVFKGFFTDLESDLNVYDLSKIFQLNPNISIEEINSYKKIFNLYTNKFIDLISLLKIDLKLPATIVDEMLKTGWIYLLYSLADCAIEKTLDLILVDPEYENKIKMITNNTILFSNIRQLIMKNCGNQINDFITLINGMTRSLAKD